MQTFKSIIGGAEEEAFEKFPWLKKASFQDAEIDITADWLIWKSGTWKGGFWKSGTWKDGIWKGGRMWSNRLQTYETIKQVDGKFEVG